jgi:hypothetical protein
MVAQPSARCNSQEDRSDVPVVFVPPPSDEKQRPEPDSSDDKSMRAAAGLPAPAGIHGEPMTMPRIISPRWSGISARSQNKGTNQFNRTETSSSPPPFG